MDFTKDIASYQVIIMEIAICWIVSMVLFSLMDLYAKKKLGGKDKLAYKVLRIPKFLTMCAVSAYAVVIVIICIIRKENFSVTRDVLTYMDLPFFIGWVYYLVSVFRRIRAER
jgi:hypothetical protein